MGKTIALGKLAQKKYVLVEGLPTAVTDTIGDIEDAWDAIIYGASGNGKSNYAANLLAELIVAMQCKCEYVSYEEGHSLSIQKTLIGRADLLNRIGNNMQITDHLTFAQLDAKMKKNKSAKIWVIDSLQTSGLTFDQVKQLRDKYVLGRKRKIIIYISWSEGKEPLGSMAKAVKYWAMIKLRVEGFLVFPISRYGGNKNFVIWEAGAKKIWGEEYYKLTEQEKPKKKKAVKPVAALEPVTEPEPLIQLEIENL